jgi:hypothetical protein
MNVDGAKTGVMSGVSAAACVIWFVSAVVILAGT